MWVWVEARSCWLSSSIALIHTHTHIQGLSPIWPVIASKLAQRIPSLPSKLRGYRWATTSTGDLNSGPYPWIANGLAIEPSSQS